MTRQRMILKPKKPFSVNWESYFLNDQSKTNNIPNEDLGLIGNTFNGNLNYLDDPTLLPVKHSSVINNKPLKCNNIKRKMQKD